jgi:hypothetical protein
MAEIPDQRILTLESRVVEQGCPLHIRHHIPVIHKLDHPLGTWYNAEKMIDGIMKTWQRFLIKR